MQIFHTNTHLPTYLQDFNIQAIFCVGGYRKSVFLYLALPHPHPQEEREREKNIFWHPVKDLFTSSILTISLKKLSTFCWLQNMEKKILAKASMVLSIRKEPLTICSRSIVHNQCDQMAILLFNLWPFTTMTICHIA